MMNALIIGATGTIGSGVIDTFKENGYKTLGVTRSTDPSIDLEDPGSIDQFFADNKGFDVIISAAGFAKFGALDDLEEEDYQKSLNSKLMGQIRLVRKGLPHLNEGGHIVVTGGMLAYSPWPETTAVTAVNAGLEGFVRAVNKEIDGDKKVHIVHPPMLAESAEAQDMDPSPFPDSKGVSKAYLKAVEKKNASEVVFVEGHGPG